MAYRKDGRAAQRKDTGDKRILVVNPNTLNDVTAMVAVEARNAASPGTEIVAVTAPFGVPGIDARADAVIAAHATLATFAENGQGFDAGVVACFSDPGLAAARQSMTFPAVGIAEAAFFKAAMLAGRCSVVTIGGSSLEPMISELAASYGPDEAVQAEGRQPHALPQAKAMSGTSPALAAGFSPKD